ncbi:uncharacterized protein LOC144110114 [Amblyomma americanum]
MGVDGDDETRKRKKPLVVKYVCLAFCLVFLVLLAFSLAYPLRYLFAKRVVVDNATENSGVNSNITGDAAPDDFLASNGGFKGEFSSTKKSPHSEFTPLPTTPPPTTPESTTTSQSTTAPTPVAPTPQSTTKPSTETATSTGGGVRRHPRHVISPSSTNHTNSSGTSNTKEYMHGKKITLQVAYDCYCPRSRQFIVSQLLPVYEELRDYLNLTLLPTSRAKNKTEGNSAIISVECEPGNKECQSSMVQTCVLNHVEETLTAVKIIACMSNSSDPHAVGHSCVKKYGLEWQLVDLCVTEKGKLYMLDVSQKVSRISGDLGNGPLVSVLDEKQRVVQLEGETNLLDLVCNQMHQDHKACAGRRNGTTISTPNDVAGNYSVTARPSKPKEKSSKQDEAMMGRP